MNKWIESDGLWKERTRLTNMSIEAIVWAYTVNATPQERNVLFAFSAFANGGNIARPGMDNLAATTFMSDAAIHRAIDGLIEKGLIKRVETGHRGWASTYELRVSNSVLYDAKDTENDTPLIDILINLLIKNGVPNSVSYPAKDTENDSLSEPTDDFTAMQFLVEEMTTYPIPNNPAEIEAINELIKIGATRDDFTAALAFLKGKKVARGACDLLPSIRYNLAKRMQAGNATPSKSKTDIIDYDN